MEQMMSVCRNPWCKATFFYTEEDMITPKNENIRNGKIDVILNEMEKEPPMHCKKCQSFDKELSGGSSWVDKEYEGSRFDGMPHQIKYKVTNYRL